MADLEKEVSEFPWHYDEMETCYLLEGDVTVTPDGGQPVRFGKGDLVTFPVGYVVHVDGPQAGAEALHVWVNCTARLVEVIPSFCDEQPRPHNHSFESMSLGELDLQKSPARWRQTKPEVTANQGSDAVDRCAASGAQRTARK